MRRHVLSFPPLLPNRSPIVMSAGELESGNAGEPAALIRQRYREASDIIKKGKMCCLFINDLDAGAGRMGGTTQYTVNNQMVNATLMNKETVISTSQHLNVQTSACNTRIRRSSGSQEQASHSSRGGATGLSKIVR